MGQKFRKIYGDRMHEVKEVEKSVIEEGNCIILCPYCGTEEIQVLEEVISKCPSCGTSFTLEQRNIIYEVKK